ncbi:MULTISPECIES: hypothetical protein [unclassified Streptomyces]|uniref:hypothetical protein n=1 Tax=unclassified Streptomyces TaxID=2593676 RepID=UPI0023651F52|nr:MULTISPECIES: hypothetical protein [unclassified Streptomyces]MDF3148813.1 hypothetical protein [Streptomyces sp. T21Q-yed]WDF38932.1 hypothetical protein PBV52_20070 [Streptomyces sp. T12]
MTAEEVSRERNPLLEAVGRVTLAGARLDSALRGLLGSLAPEPTLISYANAEGTDRLIDLCKLALEIRKVPAEDEAAVKDCLTRARALKDQRNRVVHSLFAPEEEGDGFAAMKPLKKSIGLSVSKMTIASMEKTADEIEDLLADLFRAGWNARSHVTGMPRMPNPAPGEAPSKVQYGAFGHGPLRFPTNPTAESPRDV